MKKCFECESVFLIHEHHVIPKVLGGIKTIPLCSQCHSKIHNKNIYKMSHLSKIGMAKAKKNGIIFGRKKGSKISPEFFLKKHKDVVDLLLKQYSIRNISKMTKKGISTVQRVRKVLTTDHKKL